MKAEYSLEYCIFLPTNTSFSSRLKKLSKTPATSSKEIPEKSKLEFEECHPIMPCLKFIQRMDLCNSGEKNGRSKSNKNKVGELDVVESENLICKGGCYGHQAIVFLSEKFILYSRCHHSNGPFRGKLTDGPGLLP